MNGFFGLLSCFSFSCGEHAFPFMNGLFLSHLNGLLLSHLNGLFLSHLNGLLLSHMIGMLFL